MVLPQTVFFPHHLLPLHIFEPRDQRGQGDGRGKKGHQSAQHAKPVNLKKCGDDFHAKARSVNRLAKPILPQRRRDAEGYPKKSLRSLRLSGQKNYNPSLRANSVEMVETPAVSTTQASHSLVFSAWASASSWVTWVSRCVSLPLRRSLISEISPMIHFWLASIVTIRLSKPWMSADKFFGGMAGDRLSLSNLTTWRTQRPGRCGSFPRPFRDGRSAHSSPRRRAI